jgi:hypothetical protein
MITGTCGDHWITSKGMWARVLGVDPGLRPKTRTVTNVPSAQVRRRWKKEGNQKAGPMLKFEPFYSSSSISLTTIATVDYPIRSQNSAPASQISPEVTQHQYAR